MKHEEVVQMRFISNLIKKYKRATPKQLVLAGVFMLALAGAIGAGFASQTMTSAKVLCTLDSPSCPPPTSTTSTGSQTASTGSNNDVMYGGASTPQAFCNKLGGGDGKHSASSLQAVYGDGQVGLPYNKCGEFKNEAKMGWLYRDGRVEIDGATNDPVAADGHTVGRNNYTHNGVPVSSVSLGGQSFYMGVPDQRWTSGTSRLRVMVWFDGNGVVQTVVMTDCGNPVIDYDKPYAKCNALNYYPAERDRNGTTNKYRFNTSATKDSHGMAQFVRFDYYKDGVKFDSTSSPDELTDVIELTKTSTITVKVVFTLPGSRGVERIAEAELCKKVIKVEEEKFTYTCDLLYATSVDNITFRFNIKESHSSNVSLISADFTLDGTTTTKNVTSKNGSGEIYKDYTFTKDGKTHVITAVVNYEYTKDGQVVKAQSKELCQSKVTTEKPPVCEFNPNLPPNHPDCKPKETCIPQGKEDANCQLPSTGPAGVAGLFAGVTAAGAMGHRLFMNYRSRR